MKKQLLLLLLPLFAILSACENASWNPNAPGISAQERQERIEYLDQLREAREARREKERDNRR